MRLAVGLGNLHLSIVTPIFQETTRQLVTMRSIGDYFIPSLNEIGTLGIRVKWLGSFIYLIKTRLPKWLR